MKQTQQRVALAGLLALALAISGCKSTQGDSGARGSSGATGATGTDINRDYSLPTGKPTDTRGNTGTPGVRTNTGAEGETTIQDGPGSSGGSAAAGASGSGTGTSTDTSSLQDDRGNTASIATIIPNSTVLAIEAVPQSSGITEGDSTMGTSGGAGATGSSDAGQPWRVTVRMDDGSTQVVTHSGTPDFRSGDRINVTNGAVQR